MSKKSTNKIQKSSEDKVANIVIEVLNANKDKKLATKEIYQLVVSHMTKNNLMEKDDMKTYEGRSTTRLKSTIDNLFSHKNPKIFKEFNVTKEKGRSIVKGQMFFDFDNLDIQDPSIATAEYSVWTPKSEELDEVRKLMWENVVVNSGVQYGQAEVVINGISDENLIKWVNEKGGVDNFKVELKEGKINYETARGLSKIVNFDRSIQALHDAIMSNKPVLIVRDFDNDGVGIGAALDLLLEQVEAAGIEHKVEIRQTKGGDIRGIDSVQDFEYFKEVQAKYPNEELEYLFTFDNGVSNYEEVQKIFKKMKYKKVPKVNIVDHHTKDEDAIILDNENYFHTNPQLTPGDVIKPSAGAMASEISKQVYIKLMGSDADNLVADHFDRIAEHANVADMVPVGPENLLKTNHEQQVAGEIIAMLNTYIKYENFFRNQSQLESFLKETMGTAGGELLHRFQFLSKKAEIILNNKDKSLDEIVKLVLAEKTNPTGQQVTEYSISDLRVFVAKETYANSKTQRDKAEYAMDVFREIKQVDKEIIAQMRREKERYILLDHKEFNEKTGETTFVRVYNEESSAPTKLIDAAFPKPTTNYTASVKIKEIKRGVMKYAGGFRSKLPGGHTNFDALNNDQNSMIYKGHHGAAGVIGEFKGNDKKSFLQFAKTLAKQANKISSDVKKDMVNTDHIIEIDNNSIYQINLISAINNLFDAHMFAIDAGFKMAIKGSIINEQLRKVDPEKAYGAIAASFDGSAIIVPNEKYNDEEYIVFTSLSGGSWIADGGSTNKESLERLDKIYDEQQMLIDARSQEEYSENNALIHQKMTLEEQEELFEGQGRYAEKNFKRSRGLIVQQMLEKGFQTSIVYDIEATGSTRGVEAGEEGKTEESRKGKEPDEVINGQFVIRKVVGGKDLKKETFNKRLFYLEDGTMVLLKEKAHILMDKIHSDKIIKDENKNIIPDGLIKTSDYEEIFSMEEKDDKVIYNHELDVELVDWLVDIEGSLPFSVVALTHITKDILTKYGHKAEKVNKELEQLIEKLEKELEPGKKISIAAHNIGYDAGMTPQNLPFYEKIATSDKFVQIDTTHTVREVEMKSISYAAYKYGNFSTILQGFENTINAKLFDKRYTLADFLVAREPGSQLVNLISMGERFEYRMNGEKLNLLYINVKTGKEEKVIDDARKESLSDAELLSGIEYNAKKPAKYSMQKILDTTTIDGIMFSGIDENYKRNPVIVEGVMDTLNDDKLAEIVKVYMDNYVFTQSVYQNVNLLTYTVINIEGKTTNVEKYLEQVVQKEFIESELSYKSEEELKEYFTSGGVKDFMANKNILPVSKMTKHGKGELAEKIYLKKLDIEEIFKEYLVDNKELAELYELKVISHAIIPQLKSLPVPLKDEDEWIERISKSTGIDEKSLGKIIKLVNKKSKELDESPFEIEPHANIGLISDASAEGFMIALYKILYASNKPMNKAFIKELQAYQESLEILKSLKARANAAITKDMESKIQAQLPQGQKLRVAVTDDSLLTQDERIYIIPKKEISEEEYKEINKDANSYYSIIAYENTLEKMVAQIGKATNSLTLKNDGTLDKNEAVFDEWDKQISEGEMLSRDAKRAYDAVELYENIKGLKAKKIDLENRLKNDPRFDIQINKEAAIRRKVMTATFEMFSYLLEKNYFPIEEKKSLEKQIIRDAKVELKDMTDFEKETIEIIEKQMIRIIEAEATFREDKYGESGEIANIEEYKNIVYNFVLGRLRSTTMIDKIKSQEMQTYDKTFNEVRAHMDKKFNPYGSVRKKENTKDKGHPPSESK